MHIQVLNKRKGPMTQSKIPQGTIHQMRGGGGLRLSCLSHYIKVKGIKHSYWHSKYIYEI
jgi:hypothetical protein